MCKYSSLRVLLMLPVISNTFAQSIIPGTCAPVSSLPLDIPTIKPVLFPTSCLPACSNCDQTLFSMQSLNAAIGTTVVSGPKSEKNIAPCEALQFFREMDRCKKCDLCFVVLILAIKDGKWAVTGQGVRMTDGTILVNYFSIQYGTNFKVKFHCGATRNIKCIQSLKCSKNIFDTFVYMALLSLEESCTSSCSCADCSSDNCFVEPRLGTCQSPLVPGCLITPTNGNCTDFDLMCVSAYYIPDATVDKTLSIAIPDDPKKFSAGSIGGVFISEDCEVLGMAAIKPMIAAQTLSKAPILGQLATGCAMFVLPVE